MTLFPQFLRKMEKKSLWTQEKIYFASRDRK
jgi:hypothetical protein